MGNNVENVVESVKNCVDSILWKLKTGWKTDFTNCKIHFLVVFRIKNCLKTETFPQE